MIVISDTFTGKEAVMVTAKYAPITSGAMVGSRWSVILTEWAEVPTGLGYDRQGNSSTGSVRYHRQNETRVCLEEEIGR